MRYVDKDKILDYIETLADKTIIIEIPKEEEIDWNLLKTYSEKIHLITALNNLNMIKECRENNIKWYWTFPITSYFELKGIVALNPSYLLLGAPLCFDLKNVKNYNIPIRLCPNLAYDAYIPRENGICGQWIRPEGIPAYEEFVDTFEFITTDLKHEATLFHIYKDNKVWPGNLNLLFTNFNFNVDNRGLPEEIDKIRTNCSHRCMSTGTCHFCETAMRFSDTLRKNKSHLQERI